MQAGNASECGQCFSLSWMPSKPHHHLAAGFYDGESPSGIRGAFGEPTAEFLGSPQQAEARAELRVPSAAAWGRGEPAGPVRGSVGASSSKWWAPCRNPSARPRDRGRACRGLAVGTLVYPLAPRMWLRVNPRLSALPGCSFVSGFWCSAAPCCAARTGPKPQPWPCRCPAPSPAPPQVPRCGAGHPLRHGRDGGAAPHRHGSRPTGTVAVWNLLTKSLLQCVHQPDGSLKLYPFQCFLAHDHAVRSMEWCKADR